MDKLVNLLAAILGARVIVGYAITCDCRMFTTTDREAAEGVRDLIPANGKCQSCDSEIRLYAAHDVERTDTSILTNIIRMNRDFKPYGIDPDAGGNHREATG